MRLYYHYCLAGFSNCYLVGTDLFSKEAPSQKAPSEEAIIIDPGIMDCSMLNIIEENNYSILGVLITHDHPHHVMGLRSILRIYDTKVFAINPVVWGHRSTLVHDGETISLGSFKIEVFSVPGHSADSAVFRIERLLFTGDALSAGLMGSTASSYSDANQASALRRKILSLPGDYTILPGHGPPSSLEVERRFNLDLNSFEQQKTRRQSFRFDF